MIEDLSTQISHIDTFLEVMYSQLMAKKNLYVWEGIFVDCVHNSQA